MFLALTSDTADGHAYCHDAFRKGAAACLVDRPETATSLEGPCLLVEHTREALGQLAHGYRSEHPARFIAVTGSVGKTSVKELIAAMLSAEKPTYRSHANWNNDIGLPISMLHMPDDAAVGVFELGMNHPGELDPLCRILKPHASVVTAIGPVHIEFFDSVEAIAMEKAAVCRAIPPGGYTVLAADGSWFDILRNQCGGAAITVAPTMTAADYVFTRQGSEWEFMDVDSGASIRFTPSLPGDYMVRNAVLAAAVARREGAGWEAIRAAIESYRPLAMRWNRNVNRRGAGVINDAYNANPVSMRAAIDALMQMPCRGRRWAVLGGMRELGAMDRDAHVELGRYAGSRSELHTVAVGSRSSWIREGFLSVGGEPDRVHAFEDAGTAAEWLGEQTGDGDEILLKASRGERFERIADALGAGSRDHEKRNAEIGTKPANAFGNGSGSAERA